MIMAQERMILKGQAQLEEMAGFVRQAAKDGRSIDQVERGLWSSLLRLGHAMLVGYYSDTEYLNTLRFVSYRST